MDQIIRKLIAIHKPLYSRDDVDRLYVSTKEVGTRLGSSKESVDTSIQRHEDYVQKREERLITATRDNTDNTSTNRTTITRKQK